MTVSGGHDPAWSMADGAHTKSAQTALGCRFTDIPEHVGSLVDPWTWAARLYRHALRSNRNHGGDMLRYYAGVPLEPQVAPPFRAFLQGITHIGGREPFHMPIGIAHTDAAYPPPAGESGLWTWGVRYLFQSLDGDWLVDAMWDASRPYDVMEQVLGRPLNRVKHHPRNTAAGSEQRHIGPQLSDYRDWYDDEMIGWVAEADADLIDTFGFEPFASPGWLTFSLPGREGRARLVTPDLGRFREGSFGRDVNLSRVA